MMIKFVCEKCHDDLCKYLNMEIEIMTIPNIAKEKCPICGYRIGKYAINESYIQDYTTMIINFRLTRSMVIEWAKERKLYENSEPKDQLAKLMEELGELSRAILHNNTDNQIDSIGDLQIVLINLCYKLSLNPEYCLYKAYEQIKDRKGEMKNGTFIKEEINSQEIAKDFINGFKGEDGIKCEPFGEQLELNLIAGISMLIDKYSN